MRIRYPPAIGLQVFFNIVAPVLYACGAGIAHADALADHETAKIEYLIHCAFRRWRTVDPGMTDSLGAKRRKLCGSAILRSFFFTKRSEGVAESALSAGRSVFILTIIVRVYSE